MGLFDEKKTRCRKSCDIVSLSELMQICNKIQVKHNNFPYKNFLSIQKKTSKFVVSMELPGRLKLTFSCNFKSKVSDSYVNMSLQHCYTDHLYLSD
jgi:hypothetical protein